jgi:hypothetical protein
MDETRPRDLADFYRLLDETGRLEEALARYPGFEDELRAHLALRRDLAGLWAEGPAPVVVASRRRLVLSSVQSIAGREGETMSWKKLTRLASPVAALGLFAFAVLGAGAASGGVNVPGFSDVLGVSAQNTNGSDGQHNGRDQDRNDDASPKAGASATPAATSTPGDEKGSVGALDVNGTPEGTATPAHGGAVSQAVHDAIASSTPGPGRGIAVSEAACAAAHDRSTLPEGAQNAPGQQDREPKDCAHPNADGTPGKGNQPGGAPESGTAGESAPGPGDHGQGHGPSGNPGKGNDR